MKIIAICILFGIVFAVWISYLAIAHWKKYRRPRKHNQELIRLLQEENWLNSQALQAVQDMLLTAVENRDDPE